MARNLEGRVTALESSGGGRKRPAPSRTELEAWVLDAEIRELEEEIAAIEKELDDDDDH